ncbi:hypothetical protein NKOR_00630 [Candidatus Nitrosopumilus koreensis AR1]|uniref:Uncharacterized protein n=1 Tax=Candidatus Nitrosopumilus koreensis AR1 TaxID=1229908 RepID=K0B3K0_9ARCH|nr:MULTISPECIES: hypothetical protein [Nitrosopumilus]AFS80044.1 hypothetical protein NKOR_00630 [Candidatus Nitrosopumilus koreensis AR1]
MTRTGKKLMALDDRLVSRIQERGTRGNVIKSLAELVKNCDDAYDRLELQGEKTSGIIEIGYWKLPKGKGFSVSGFFVRDFGAGMSTEQLTNAYFSESPDKGNYGSDTSGDTRNGAIGVGGKDCFKNMVDCLIISVKDNQLTVADIETDVRTDRLASEIISGEDATPYLQQVNNMLKNSAESIDLSKNQTFAMFRLPEHHSGSRTDTLAEQLTNFYTLRWIMESNIRKVKLIDVTTGQTSILKHIPTPGEVIFEKSFTIPYSNIGYDVLVQIKKSETDLDHKSDFGENILIKDNRGAILDNKLFGYESDSGANRIFGQVVINDWKKLYRLEKGKILTDQREGLDYNHKFNKLLEQIIRTHLKPIIDAEKEKQGSNPRLEQGLDKNIKKAFAFINKIMMKDPDAGTHEEELPDVPPEGIEFSKPSLTIPFEKTKKLKLLLNPGRVPTNSEIALRVFGEAITISPENSISAPGTYDVDVPYVEIEITGKKLNARSTLKAYFGEMVAETEIFVVPEQFFQPKHGFAFKPSKANLIPKKSRKIKLVIDTNLVDPGTPIEISCDDERVEFSPKKLTVTNPPNLGKYLTEEIIEISCSKLGLKAKLVAETKTNAGEDRQAICELEVKEKEPPKQFFKDYELDPKGEKRVRSRFKDGIIYVHVNAPILLFTFGRNQKNLRDKKAEAIFMLADTVVQRMAMEWATWKADNNKLDILSDRATEIQVEKNSIEYEYGLQIHQMIVQGFTKKLEDL